MTQSDDPVDPEWWEALLGQAGDSETPELMSGAFRAALEAQNLPARQREVLHSLEIATSALLDPECWTQPFTPAVRIRDRRSALPEDLTEDQLSLLSSIAPLIKNRALRARVADVAWCYGDRGRKDLLDIAIEAYRDAPLEDETWIDSGKAAWQRAFELLLRQGESGRTQIHEMNDSLLQCIADGQAHDSFMTAEVSQLLRQRSQPNEHSSTTATAQYLQARAASTADSHRRVARMLEREASQWFRVSRNVDAANHCLARVVDLYVADADSKAGQHPAVAAGASVFLEKAIAVLAALPRDFREQNKLDDRIVTLRGRLKRMRVSLVSQMVRYESDPIDISGFVESARQRVAGLEKFHAIAELGDIIPLADSAKMLDSARERRSGSLSALFRRETLSHDGRKIAAAAASVDDEQTGAWTEAVRDFRTHVELVTAGFIIPALEVVNFEHRWDQQFIVSLCRESPIVQSAQALQWAVGILHGFNSEYASAMLVLVPLLENSVRSILQSNGVYTLLADADGVESEKGLGALVATPEAAHLLGADLVFVICALLTDRAGLNLRNNSAHGLLSDQQAWSYGAVYIWWLCLKIVIVPVWNAYSANGTDDSPAN